MTPDIKIQEPQPAGAKDRGLLGALKRLVAAALEPLPAGTAPSDAAIGANDEKRRSMPRRVVLRGPQQMETPETPQINRFREIPNVMLPSGKGLSDAAIGELDRIKRDLELGKW